MLLAIALAVAAAVGWGSADFLGGLSRDRTSVFAVVAVSELIGAALVAPVMAVAGLPHWDPSLLLACAAGVAVTVELSIIYHALSVGAAFITAPIGALGAGLAVTAGLIGGDPLGPWTAIGLACAVIGGGMSAGAGNGEARRRLSLGRSVAACCTAAVAVAVMQITLHAAGKVNPYWATGLEHLSTAASAMAIGGARAWRRARSGDRHTERALPERGQLPMLALVAAAGVVGDLAYAAAAGGTLSTVSAIASLYPIPTIALGLAVQRRRSTRQQAAGIVLALAGAAILGAAAG